MILPNVQLRYCYKRYNCSSAHSVCVIRRESLKPMLCTVLQCNKLCSMEPLNISTKSTKKTCTITAVYARAYISSSEYASMYWHCSGSISEPVKFDEQQDVSSALYTSGGVMLRTLIIAINARNIDNMMQETMQIRNMMMICCIWLIDSRSQLSPIGRYRMNPRTVIQTPCTE